MKKSKKEIKQGKRYTFYTQTDGYTGTPTEDSHEISALFTGEYDKNNGNAILFDNKGNQWSVPLESLFQ